MLGFRSMEGNMMVLSAKKRGTVFAARSRQRRQAEPEQASQPKPAEPTPAALNPQPEPDPAPQPAAVQAELETPEQPLGDLREVAALAEAAQGCTCGPGGGCDMDDCKGTPRGYTEQTGKRGRGRPRPQETIDRDRDVYARLSMNPQGLSKAELAEALQEKEQQVYSSLRQLSQDGQAKSAYVKGAGWRWFAV